jgi:hypothetical protein
MERFLAQHQGDIVGVLSGWDRLLLRGTLPSLNNPISLHICLRYHGILYQEFASFAERCGQEIKAHAEAIARKHGRPCRYLYSPSISKEAVAREIMAADGISEGLICVLTCVETSATYRWRRDGHRRKLPLGRAQRPCLHIYFYYLDREFGLMHVRVQTWLPFTIQVCINGREYLARQLSRQGIGFEKRDNCFTRIDDMPRAQQLLDELTGRNWVPFLNALARRLNPVLDARLGLDRHGYYWTMRQSEYASDVMFRNASRLRRLYPKLVSHAIQQLTCEDVLRFLGRRRDARTLGEVTSDCIRRLEGTRVKHRLAENSIKMYDKQGSVLRVETTINDPRRFSVFRQATRHGQPIRCWRPMRKGVVDAVRRAEVSRRANERYLEALAVVSMPQPVAQTFDPVSARLVRGGRRYRALRPLTSEETALFQAVMHGEFLVQGFRNQDLRRLLLPSADSNRKRRQQASGRITRLLRLLRAHALIRKVSHTRLYRVTPKGHKLMSLALKLRHTDLAKLAA